jgi:hypothetical protein
MEVYVVVFESFDGDECEVYGVFMSKSSAEKQIKDKIAGWGNDEFTFTRTDDRWVLDGGENEYRIETRILKD